MELKPGFRQTEVEVISKDWNVRSLVSLATEIGDGIHSTPRYVKSSPFYFVNGNNLVGGSIVVTEETMCVSEAEYNALRKNLTDRTLLLSINGTIGNLALYRGEKVVLGKSAAYINVSDKVSREFISFCLKSRSTALFFENELTGTTIRNLSLQSLRNTPVSVPSTREEQRANAAALSDVDSLIDALEQLIAKKRDLKLAAMQQLLTGKKRLAGFGGNWKTRPLGELIAYCSSGATPYRGHPEYYKGTVKWITSPKISAFWIAACRNSVRSKECLIKGLTTLDLASLRCGLDSNRYRKNK
jgi:type I restriction enzyme, S subunit